MQRPSFDILFVEDDSGIREIVLEVLTLWGYTITALDSAEAAMARMTDGHRYAVLITDVTLPCASGIDLAKQAYALNPTMHIIFTTGDGYLLAPPLPFSFTLIAKPFNLAKLREAIQIGLTGAARSVSQQSSRDFAAQRNPQPLKNAHGANQEHLFLLGHSVRGCSFVSVRRLWAECDSAQRSALGWHLCS